MGGHQGFTQKKHHQSLEQNLKIVVGKNRHDWDVMADVGTKAMGTDTLGTFAWTSLCLCSSGRAGR